ncbi:HSP20-like chaperone [Irpex rosettiformis]|uniref:HSP20-like chaperone n=1 Tax=Irpex rosettiformis TaxID=378272 RepID=A0ACB8TX40_9APHY|nr:HSP20-like chaperone [Irpex rosettiformis]
MLEEPLGRSPAYLGPAHRPFIEDSFFRDSFQNALRPAVDVSEQGNNYIVEAELPGVQKENVQVRIGDGGRSVTIEGKVCYSGSKAVTTAGSEATQLTTERSFVGTSSFTRTVWLPRRVDSSNVSAQLKDGVLTLTIPKAEDPGSVEVPVQ